MTSVPALFRKTAVAPLGVENMSALIPTVEQPWTGVFGSVQEAFSGAWQRNIVVDTRENLLAYSPVFAGVSLISGDISKIRLKLTEQSEDGKVWNEILSGAPAFLPVIRKPNRYQTRAQFVSSWIISKLLHGNTYVLKVRDARNVVTDLYVMEPNRTSVLVADDGSVWYRFKRDPLSEITEDDTIIPASEVIHDRMMCLWHPLVGISPLFGCGRSATQGLRIQNNSEKFFANMSRPSGVLTSPHRIGDPTAARLKKEWNENYSADSLGKTAVLGDGLRYEPMSVPAQQSQMIEQMVNTAESVAQCLHIPLHMLQMGGAPPLASIGAINQLYYSQALQALLNDLEDTLTEGLGLPPTRYVEFDLDDLMRLDPQARADASAKGIGAGYLKPNEARQRENLEDVQGGNTPYLQQQNYSLAALDERDKQQPLIAPPPAPAAPSMPALPAPEAAAAMAAAEATANKAAMLEAFVLATKELEHA